MVKILNSSKRVKPRFSRFTFKKSRLENYSFKSRLKSLKITKSWFDSVNTVYFLWGWKLAYWFGLKHWFSDVPVLNIFLLFQVWKSKRKKSYLCYHTSKIIFIFLCLWLTSCKLLIFISQFFLNVWLYWIKVISFMGCQSNVTFTTDFQISSFVICTYLTKTISL